MSERSGTTALLGDGLGPVPGRTPCLRAEMRLGRRRAVLWLKLEQYNPFGSIKDRVAFSLLRNLDLTRSGRPALIESTSGNLGYALASYARAMGLRFTAVIDPRTSALLVTRMREAGATVVTVTDHDDAGGYLLTRLRHVRAALRRDSELIWPNQYRNPANPTAHYHQTAPELRRAVGDGPATVFAAISTGGTISGIHRYVTANDLPWTCIAVDETGSAALGGPPGDRRLTGIGSSALSTFVTLADVTSLPVRAAEAVRACDWVRERLGVHVGGSSGAVVAGALAAFRRGDVDGDLVCVCPDGGDRYTDTIYSEAWRRATDLDLSSGESEFPEVEARRLITDDARLLTVKS